MAILQSRLLLNVLNWGAHRIATAEKKSDFGLCTSNTAIFLFARVRIVIFESIWVDIFTRSVKVMRSQTLILLLIAVQICFWPLMAKSCHYFSTIFAHFAALNSLGMRVILGIFYYWRSNWSILVTCGER